MNALLPLAETDLALPPHPTLCEVDLGAIAYNVRRLQQIVGSGTAVMGVVKANGYGHGAIPVARAAAGAGAAWLGVSAPSEGVALREAGIAARILVLGYTPANLAHTAIANDLTLTLYDLDLAAQYAAAARRAGRIARVHVKVDTGMGRLGVLPAEALDFIRAVHGLVDLQVEALYTHFSTADSADQSYTQDQFRKFQAVVSALEAAGFRPPLLHAANTAGTLAAPAARLDLVRTGIAMYGLDPSEAVPCPPDFRPALTWKTSVSSVKRLGPGQPVSYGNTYVTQGEEQIAVAPVGYADGFRIARDNEVLVHGRRAPVVGRVCMDQIMINVTGVPGVALGDEVVLLGRQGGEAISAADLAGRWGTISYEVICGLSARVHRQYLA